MCRSTTTRTWGSWGSDIRRRWGANRCVRVGRTPGGDPSAVGSGPVRRRGDAGSRTRRCPSTAAAGWSGPGGPTVQRGAGWERDHRRGLVIAQETTGTGAGGAQRSAPSGRNSLGWVLESMNRRAPHPGTGVAIHLREKGAESSRLGGAFPGGAHRQSVWTPFPEIPGLPLRGGVPGGPREEGITVRFRRIPSPGCSTGWRSGPTLGEGLAVFLQEHHSRKEVAGPGPGRRGIGSGGPSREPAAGI